MWNTFLKALLVGLILNSFSNQLTAAEEEVTSLPEQGSADATEESKEPEQNLVYMFSDLQGRHAALKDVLINYQIVDGESKWLSASNDLVLMGNLLGDASSAYETLSYLRTIQQSATQAEAQFKVVLGEKDIEFVLSEIGRYPVVAVLDSPVENQINTESETATSSETSTESELNTDSEINTEAESSPEKSSQGEPQNASNSEQRQQLLNWLSDQDFIVQLNGHLFVNGGISSRVKKKTLEEINQTLKNSLDAYQTRWQAILEQDAALREAQFSERYSVVKSLADSDQKKSFLKTQRSHLFSKFWPVNYTGNSFCHPLFERQNLDEALQRWQINKVWSARAEYKDHKLQDRFQGKMTFIDEDAASTVDSDILGAVINEDGTYKLIQGNNEISDSPKSIAARKYQLPYDMTTDEIKAFLKTAKVVSKEQTKEGKTKPLKVYLEKGDKRIKAIFKYVNASGRGNRKGVPRTGDKFDYESAAYTLDGMLGIGLIPITVERVVNNKRGVVQLWIDGLVSAVPLNTREETYTGTCDAQQQENMINTFDYLIMNLDRNQTNITFTKKDWQIWFIDHTRSFGNDTKAPRFLRGVRIEPTNLFKEKLSQISREQLNDLSLWLSEKQLNAMWERRNRLIESDYILD